MQARDNITEEMKEAAHRSEAKPFAAMDSVWDRIEERLDEEENKRGKGIVIPFRTVSIAAAVVVLFTLGGVYLSQKNETVKKQEEQTYVRREAGHSALPADGPATVNDIRSTQPPVQPPSVPVANTTQNKIAARQAHVQNQVAPRVIQPPVRQEDNHDVFIAQKVIKGNVKDENGEPVPGAMVIVKGLREGVITDMDGNYEIKIAGDRKELEIKGLGMVAETVLVREDQLLSTTLKADKNIDLNEVRNYLPTRKQDTYVSPILTAQNQNIARRPVSDIARALEGDLPGVKIRHMNGQVGASTDFQIGGLSQGTSGPLVVIDGMFYSGSSVSLKPDELESLTVLKDETATAAYGSKGSNGVIVIKTKTGKGYSTPKNNIFRKMKGIFNRK